MYQPAHGRFTVDDPAGLLADLAAESPATLVTHGSAGFSTSILPMLFSAADGERGALRGHLARPIRSGTRRRTDPPRRSRSSTDPTPT